MSSVTVEKETNLISGQPPNTVDGRPDAAMDTMQLALLQLLRTLLFVPARMWVIMNFLARCITVTVVAGHYHGFQAAMWGWCPATMWIAHDRKHADQKEHCLSFRFFSGLVWPFPPIWNLKTQHVRWSNLCGVSNIEFSAFWMHHCGLW